MVKCPQKRSGPTKIFAKVKNVLRRILLFRSSRSTELQIKQNAGALPPITEAKSTHSEQRLALGSGTFCSAGIHAYAKIVRA